LDDHERDLSIREADIAVRFLPPKRPDLIQRHLLKTHHRVFASPEYLKTYGIPKKPEELHKHRLIIYGDDYKPPLENINWLVHAGLPDKQAHTPILRVNNIYGMYRAVQSGLGIAALPDYFQPEQNNLVEILPELEGPPVDLFFIYPEELRNSKRVTVFREFLLRKLSQNNF
jgi:DNA-binding transcriptional LysR family regulator